jgi:glutamine synthetase
METKKSVLEYVKKYKIANIQLWFTDILGNLKCCAITSAELKSALDHGKGFDGSSVTGYAEAEESDILAKPDISTFKIVPWESEKEPVARMICDVLTPEGKPYPGCPRYALKRNIARAKKMGFMFYLGPELEYFYFKRKDKPEILDEGSYFDLVPNDVANNLRKETVKMLEDMDIGVETSHHEVAPSQHEIDLRFTDALTMADIVMAYKMIVKEVAQRHGYHATFMPKPLFGANGSGMHTHQSLFQGKRNTFFDKKDKCNLSKIAKQFIAGQLRYAREICSITAQWVNSYKRLVPGYEAPVYISWAQKNRTALIRVPVYRPGNERATRAELRCPDPACNPYLAFSVMLAAGLEGIEKKYKLPDPVEPNIYKMEMGERERKGVKALPVNLFEAVKETEKSKLVREALGEHIFTRFLHNKMKEWDEHRIQVTSHEIKKYLPIL